MAQTLGADTSSAEAQALAALPPLSNEFNNIRTVETRLGHKKVNLPAALQGTESESVRALTYYTAAAKIDAEGTGIPVRTQLDVLASVVNLSSVAEFNIAEVFRIYETAMFDPRMWTIRSYHDGDGAIMTNATLPNSTILKSAGSTTTNTVLNDLRPNDICFALVHVVLDFTHMPGNRIHCTFETFIKLPQTAIIVRNGAGGDHTLTSWCGEADLKAYTKADLQAFVLDVTLQHLPANLKAAGIGRTGCVLDTDGKDNRFRENLMVRCNKYIKDQIFETLCPGLENDPSDTLKRVKQAVTDDLGNVTRLSVHTYFANILTAVQCMPGDLEEDICVFAMRNMIKEVREQVLLTYKRHLTIRPKTKFVQITALKELKIIATIAERQIMQINNVVNRQTTANLLVHNANIGTVPGAIATSAASSISQASGIQNFASQAERTIDNNTISPFEWKWGMCLGCGGDHKYREKGTNNIVCPNKSKPGIQAIAEANVKLLRKERVAFGGSPYGRGRGRGGRDNNRNRDTRYSGQKPDWNRSNKTQKASFVASLVGNANNMDEFRNMASDFRAEARNCDRNHDRNYDRNRDNHYGPSDRNRDANRGDGNLNDDSANVATFYPCIPILHNGIDGRKPLPVAIDGQLPHAPIAICTGGGRQAFLMATIDSGAGANVAYLQKMDGVFFENPECVESFHTSFGNEYFPIKMSGIVSEDTAGVTSTELPIAVKIKTPYRHHDGSRVFITVALGLSVSVDFILSNTFLKGMGATIDYAADKMYTNIQNHDGFPLTYKRPTRTFVDPINRKGRQYFKDIMPVMIALQDILTNYHSSSKWLPHVNTLIQNVTATTLASTTVPAIMPQKSAMRKTDYVVPVCPSNGNNDANMANENSRTNDVSHSGSDAAVSFNIDGHISTSAVGGGTATYTIPIAVGNPTSDRANAESSDDEKDLFSSPCDSE